MTNEAGIGIMVFARMSSRRLPGKALLQVGSRPLLGHVLDRARRAKQAAGIVLATSTDPGDDALVDFARSEGIHCCRGPLDDVVERAVACAREQGWIAFVRVCGDRPFLDPLQIDVAIQRMQQGDSNEIDLLSNLVQAPAPPGLTVEVVRADALETVRRSTEEPRYREHITSYLYACPHMFRIVPLDGAPADAAGLRFVVDTERDLQRTRDVIAGLAEPQAARMSDVIERSRSWEQAHVGPDA